MPKGKRRGKKAPKSSAPAAQFEEDHSDREEEGGGGPDTSLKEPASKTGTMMSQVKSTLQGAISMASSLFSAPATASLASARPAVDANSHQAAAIPTPGLRLYLHVEHILIPPF
jgi:hypothetical protein